MAEHRIDAKNHFRISSPFLQFMENCGNEICGESFGYQDPYNGWNQMQLRRWLNEGEVLSPENGETINLYGKIAVLVAGQVTAPSPQIQSLLRLTWTWLKVFFRKTPRYLSATLRGRNGGEGGIRTRGTLRYTAFPMLHNRPLCHLSRLPYDLMYANCVFVNDQKAF